jgi:hypothetical protein
MPFTGDQHQVGDLEPGGEHEPFRVSVRTGCGAGAARTAISGLGQAGQLHDADERALLGLLPADGSTASSQKIRRQLGWAPERYADVGRRLEDQGHVLSGFLRPVLLISIAWPGRAAR